MKGSLKNLPLEYPLFFSMPSLIGKNTNKQMASHSCNEEKKVIAKKHSNGMYNKSIDECEDFEHQLKSFENSFNYDDKDDHSKNYNSFHSDGGNDGYLADKNTYYDGNDDNISPPSVSITSSLPPLNGKIHNTSNPSTRFLGDTKSSLSHRDSLQPRRNKSVNNSLPNTPVLPQQTKKSFLSLNIKRSSVIEVKEITTDNSKDNSSQSKRSIRYSSPSINTDIDSINTTISKDMKKTISKESVTKPLPVDKTKWYSNISSLIPDFKPKPTTLTPLESRPMVAAVDHNNHINGPKVNERLVKLGNLKLESVEKTDTSNNGNHEEKMKSPNRIIRRTIDNSSFSTPSISKSFCKDSIMSELLRLDSVSDDSQFIDNELSHSQHSELSYPSIEIDVKDYRPDSPMKKFGRKRVRNQSTPKIQLNPDNSSPISSKSFVDNLIINTGSPRTRSITDVYKF